jgi:hypothetical protein
MGGSSTDQGRIELVLYLGEEALLQPCKTGALSSAIAHLRLMHL